MNVYVALKPVRFDRTYAVGEEIPPEVIDPRSVKRLIDWGKIAIVPPDAVKADAKKPKREFDPDWVSKFLAAIDPNASDEDEEVDGENEPAIDPNAEKTEQFECKECGKTFPTKQGLAGHMRSHNNK